MNGFLRFYDEDSYMEVGVIKGYINIVVGCESNKVDFNNFDLDKDGVNDLIEFLKNKKKELE